MVGMGRSDRSHMGTIVGAIEPAHEFRPDAAADQAAAFLAQSFPRYDQHHPEVAVGRSREEPPDGLLCRRERHAVQVERSLGRQPASGQGA